MVLTNFECWAHADMNDRSIGLGENIIDRRNNVVDLFNPTLLRSSCSNNNSLPMADEAIVKPVSHLSSNGYYGFSRICHPNSTGGGGEEVKQETVAVTAAPAAGGDVNITQMENISNFMDVELPLQTNEPALVDVNMQMQPTSLHFMTRSAEQQQVAGNGNKIRRKRRFDGGAADTDDMKRCRFNTGYHHRNNDLNDGAYCKAMDHDDILHVANLATFFDGVQSFNQHERFIAPASLDAHSRNSQNVTISLNEQPISLEYPNRKCKRKYTNHCDKVKFFQGEMTDPDPGETQNNDAKRIFSNYKSKISSDTISDYQLENLFASLHGGSEWHMPHYFKNI